MAKVILRLPDVEGRVGLKRSTIYDLISKGMFPRQVPLGPKSVGFIEDEIDAWIDQRLAARDAAHQ